MKLVKAEVDTKRAEKTDWMSVLDEFRNSGNRCVRIEDYPHKNQWICCSCARAAIRRYKFHGVYAIIVGTDVYLIKED